VNAIEDKELRRAVCGLQNALRVAAGGPWCGQCGSNFRGKERRRIHDHIRHLHEFPTARALCRVFGWAWIIRPPYFRELLHRSHEYEILIAKNRRLKERIKDLEAALVLE
jgi:hypothetical protein